MSPTSTGYSIDDRRKIAASDFHRGWRDMYWALHAALRDLPAEPPAEVWTALNRVGNLAVDEAEKFAREIYPDATIATPAEFEQMVARVREGLRNTAAAALTPDALPAPDPALALLATIPEGAVSDGRGGWYVERPEPNLPDDITPDAPWCWALQETGWRCTRCPHDVKTTRHVAGSGGYIVAVWWEPGHEPAPEKAAPSDEDAKRLYLSGMHVLVVRDGENERGVIVKRDADLGTNDRLYMVRWDGDSSESWVRGSDILEVTECPYLSQLNPAPCGECDACLRRDPDPALALLATVPELDGYYLVLGSGARTACGKDAAEASWDSGLTNARDMATCPDCLAASEPWPTCRVILTAGVPCGAALPCDRHSIRDDHTPTVNERVRVPRGGTTSAAAVTGSMIDGIRQVRFPDGKHGYRREVVTYRQPSPVDAGADAASGEVEQQAQAAQARALVDKRWPACTQLVGHPVTPCGNDLPCGMHSISDDHEVQAGEFVRVLWGSPLGHTYTRAAVTVANEVRVASRPHSRHLDAVSGWRVRFPGGDDGWVDCVMTYRPVATMREFGSASPVDADATPAAGTSTPGSAL